MASRRPHRGPRNPRNVLVTGDVPGDLGSREPQGGARVKDKFRESGNLEAREFGVPQADIPGGVRHLVNPETVPHKPPATYERPADYHKYHGVESDDGQYYPPPGDVAGPRKEPGVPKVDDAVPVYIVEGGGKAKRIRVLTTEGPMAFATGTVDPIRLASRDPRRTKFWITNENQPTLPGAQGASVTATGTATTPAADATIVTTASLGAGVWTISWIVSLSGTLAAADANNMTLELDSGPTTLANSINPAVAGSYPQGAVTVVVPAGGSTISVEAIGLATTGAVYGAQIVATPVPTAAANPAGVRIGSLEDCADNRGLLILGNSTRDFNTQETVYMTNQSGSTVTLSWGEETEIPAAGLGT